MWKITYKSDSYEICFVHILNGKQKIDGNMTVVKEYVHFIKVVVFLMFLLLLVILLNTFTALSFLCFV